MNGKLFFSDDKAACGAVPLQIPLYESPASERIEAQSSYCAPNISLTYKPLFHIFPAKNTFPAKNKKRMKQLFFVSELYRDPRV